MDGPEFEGGEIAYAAGWALVFRNNQFVGTGFGIKGLAVHRVGDDYGSGMKTGVHLGERENDLVSIRAGGNKI